MVFLKSEYFPFPSINLPSSKIWRNKLNISGFAGSITAEGISLDFPSVDILGPVPWIKGSGKASTIITWRKNQDWRLIRKGEVIVKIVQDTLCMVRCIKFSC